MGGRESAEEEEEEEERECVGEPEEEEEGDGDAGNAYEAERDARVQRNRDAMIEMGLARKPPPVSEALSYVCVCGLELLLYAALSY